MRLTWLILLPIFLQLNCHTEKYLLENDWILVDERSFPNEENMPVIFRGMILQFDRTSYKMGYGTSHFEKEWNYFIENDTIKTDSFSLGKIQYISEDSLVMIRNRHEEDYLTIFYPLSKTGFNEKDFQKIEDQLLASPWEFQLKEDYFRLYCDTAIWMSRDEDYIKSIYYETSNLGKLELMSWNERWTLFRFGDRVFFYFSAGQFDFYVIQILDFNENEIKGRFYGSSHDVWYETFKSKDVVLKRCQIGQEATIKISDEDIIGKWNATIINKSKDGKSRYPLGTIDGIIMEIDQSGKEDPEFLLEYAGNPYEYKIKHAGRIRLSDIKADNISYLFEENGSYQIRAGEHLIREGQEWYLSPDNRYIILEDHYDSENFLKIEQVKDGKITIQKEEFINVEEGHRWNAFPTILKLKLEKQ